jgi:hypothetical protein
LLTKEAFESLRARLAPQGSIIANIVGSAQGEGAQVLASVVATLEAVYGKTHIFAPNRKLDANAGPNYVSTTLLLVGELPATPAPFTLPYPKEMQTYLDTVLASGVSDLAREKAVVLTDAYAPLEAWSDAAVQVMR